MNLDRRSIPRYSLIEFEGAVPFCQSGCSLKINSIETVKALGLLMGRLPRREVFEALAQEKSDTLMTGRSGLTIGD